MATVDDIVSRLAPVTAKLENFTPTSYPDGTQWSIGYGTKASGPGETITQAEAQTRLLQELTKAAGYVVGLPGADQLPLNTLMGLTDQAYNAGGFGGTLRSAIASGDTGAITKAMDLYRGTSVPGTEAGVSNRRDADIAMANGTYAGVPQTQLASFTPPTPRLREGASTAAPMLYDNGGLMGGLGAPQIQQASFQPPSNSPLLGFAPQSQAPRTAPFDAVMNQAGADVLGGGNSPLHQYTAFEASTVPAGPYGADALVRAAMSGDAGQIKAAMDAIQGAAVKENPGLILEALSGRGGPGTDAVMAKLNPYFTSLGNVAPGAVRAAQSAFTNNPELYKPLQPAQQQQLRDAFAALPAPSTGQVAMPNLRPAGGGQGASTPPLVAQQPPPPNTSPQMASFTPPSSGASPSWMDLAMRSPVVPAGSGNAALRDLFQMGGAPGGLATPVGWQQSGSAPASLRQPQANAPQGTPSFGNIAAALGALVPGMPGLTQFGSGGQGQGTDPRLPPGYTPGTPPPLSAGGNLGNDLPYNDTSGQGASNAPSDPIASWTQPRIAAPTDRVAQLLNYPSTPGGGFGQTYQPPSPVTVKPPAGSNNAGNALLGLGGAVPSSAFAPAKSPPIGTNNNFLFGGVPQLKTTAMATPMPNLRPQAPQATAVAAPRPQPVAQPMPQAAPMTPQEAFMQHAGPAPQNVDWAATLANDPYAQPGTDNTYVLNDMDANGQNNYAAATVLCTYYMRKGWLSRHLWLADGRFARTLPMRVRRGYWRWAIPTVRRLERGAPILERMLWPVVRAWAGYAAFKMGKTTKRPLSGALVHWGLGSLSWALGGAK